MKRETFEKVCRKQLTECLDVLFHKAAEYADDGDRLHNFRAAAGMTGESLRAVLSGMMMKHTISVYDLCRAEQCAPMELWKEKITDHINYLLLLRAVVEEENGTVSASD